MARPNLLRRIAASFDVLVRWEYRGPLRADIGTGQEPSGVSLAEANTRREIVSGQAEVIDAKRGVNGQARAQTVEKSHAARRVGVESNCNT